MTPRFWAVVPAAGVGRRMGSQVPKQYLAINGEAVLERTLHRLLSIECLDGITVALGSEDEFWPDLGASRDPRVRIAPGGNERADSVLSALKSLESLASPDDWVLVHDAARPCITQTDILKLIKALEHDHVGGILAIPVSDTLKTVENGLITGSPDRRLVWRALTPQMFRYGVLTQALEDAALKGKAVTDESSAVEMAGHLPKVVEGRSDNIKITQPEDLRLAAYFLEAQDAESRPRI